MRSLKLPTSLTVTSLFFLAAFVAPAQALAVPIQNLNGATGATQTFQNDSNVTMTRSGDTHILGWQNYLPISRGGTGVGSFTAGSLIFFNGSTFSENNSNLFWDNTNSRLGIGTSSPTATLDVVGDTSIDGDLNLGVNFLRLGAENDAGTIQGAHATTTDATGGWININAGNGLGSGFGGQISLVAGNAGASGVGGDVSLEAGSAGEEGDAGGVGIDGGAGGSTSGKGGFVSVSAGDALGVGDGGVADLSSGNGGTTSGNGGVVQLSGGSARGGNGDGGDIFLLGGTADGTGIKGRIIIQDGSGNNAAILDTASLVANPFTTFTFPDFPGTFGLLEANQTWTGLNKFEASTNSTIYVGSSIKSGCIAMGDSDNSGITYILANDGILTASATKPSVCQ